MTKKKSEWVSASKIGRASYCPHYLELENKGAAVSKQAQQARIKGDIEHDKINKQAEDKRCYVASHLYGINDPRTQMLREFRDDHLLKSRMGRVFIAVYYGLSPFAVTLARKNKPIDTGLSKVVGMITKQLQRKGDQP